MALKLPSLGISCGSPQQFTEERSFEAMITGARQSGTLFFETESICSGGENQLRLGDMLRKLEINDAVISAKIGKYRLPTGDQTSCYYDYSYSRTLIAVDDNLKRLKRDFLDVVFIHDLSVLMCDDRYDEFKNQAEQGAYRALEELRAQKVIGAIGFASSEWQTCLDFARIYPLDVIMQTCQYTLLNQGSEPLIEFAIKENICFIAHSPFNFAPVVKMKSQTTRFNNGMLSADAKDLDRIKQMKLACDEFGVSFVTAALQFPLQNPGVKTIVVSMFEAREIQANLVKLDQQIPQELWEILKII